MELTTCPHCSVPVVPSEDGTCPACRRNVREHAISSAARELFRAASNDAVHLRTRKRGFRALIIALDVLGIVFLLGALTRVPLVISVIARSDTISARREVVRFVASLLPSIVCFVAGARLRRKNRLSQIKGSENRRHIVNVTPRAAELAARAIASCNYPNDTVLRVVVSDDPNTPYDLKYDLPPSTDCDWISESLGVTVVVEKAIAEQVQGLTIDARDGCYVFETRDSAV